MTKEKRATEAFKRKLGLWKIPLWALVHNGSLFVEMGREKHGESLRWRRHRERSATVTIVVV
jgi:hypothetical protein